MNLDREDKGALAQIGGTADKSHLKDGHPHLLELAMTHDAPDYSVAGLIKGLGRGLSGGITSGIDTAGMWDKMKTGAGMAKAALM